MVCGRSVDAFFATILVPIPVVGSIAILSELARVKVLMRQNGYRLGFVNFHADHIEREKMRKDPTYLPGKLRRKNSMAFYVMSGILLGFICLLAF